MARRKQDNYAVEFARKGARARAASLSPERRREIARQAVLARWAKRKGFSERSEDARGEAKESKPRRQHTDVDPDEAERARIRAQWMQ